MPGILLAGESSPQLGRSPGHLVGDRAAQGEVGMMLKIEIQYIDGQVSRQIHTGWVRCMRGGPASKRGSCQTLNHQPLTIVSPAGNGGCNDCRQWAIQVLPEACLGPMPQ